MTTRATYLDTAAIRGLVRQAAAEAGGVRALARLWKVSPTYISDVLAGKAQPGDAVLRPLGMRRCILYQRTPKRP